jgi:hypothetical protein
MTKKPNTISEKDSKNLQEFARGGKAVSRSVVRKSMDIAAKDLARQFRKDAKYHAARAEQQAATTKMLIGSAVRDDPELKKALKAQIASEKRLDKSEKRHKLVKPQSVRLPKRRVVLGSIGGVETPAYNYDWNWFSSNGNIRTKIHNANRNNGTLENYLSIGGSNGSGSGELRTAVGFYLRPVVETGLLRIDVSPSHSTRVSTHTAFSSASASAWLGLFIGEYAVGSNTYLGAPVSFQNTLASHSTWWDGDATSLASSGFPMTSTINVDSSHWYAIWVWAGVRGSANGSGFLSYSAMHSRIDVTVPSFHWTLY